MIESEIIALKQDAKLATEIWFPQLSFIKIHYFPGFLTSLQWLLQIYNYSFQGTSRVIYLHQTGAEKNNLWHVTRLQSTREKKVLKQIQIYNFYFFQCWSLRFISILVLLKKLERELYKQSTFSLTKFTIQSPKKNWFWKDLKLVDIWKKKPTYNLERWCKVFHTPFNCQMFW